MGKESACPEDIFSADRLLQLSDQDLLGRSAALTVSEASAQQAADCLNKTYASVWQACTASVAELQALRMIPADLQVFLKLTEALYQNYYRSSDASVGSLHCAEQFAEVLMPFFEHLHEERVALLLLDGRNRPVYCGLLSEGSVSASDVDIRKAVELCLQKKARQAVIAHNHPSGLAFPSRSDIEMTAVLHDCLRQLGVSLRDHLIFAGQHYCCLSKHEDSAFLFSAQDKEQNREEALDEV